MWGECMIGWIRREESGAPRTECLFCGDVTVLCVRVRSGTDMCAALSARRAAALLAKKHVRIAALPMNYPYGGVFSRRGITPADPTQLAFSCADAIALCALGQQGTAPEGATVALLARRPSASLRRTAHKLARSVRYLALCTPDAEELACELRQEWGIAVQTVRAGEPLRADAALSFDAAEENCICLAEKELAVEYCAAVGTLRCTDAALLSALLCVGAIKPEEVCVGNVSLPCDAGKLCLTT